MQMLPTIADLRVKIGSGLVRNAVLNLTDNLIKIGSVKIEHGDATYLTPTAEWAKAHPAPADTAAQTGPPSPPMTIEIGMARLGFDRALYATQGAKPQPGFDPSYIEATDIQIDVDDFYNQTSTVRLPIVALSAKERSGLQITQGSGTLQVDSAGLTLQDFSVLTPASSLRASAVLPFELMAMNPKAPAGSVEASGQLAWSDIFAFMPPMRKEIARYIPSSAMAPLNFNLTGSGSLQQISIRNLALGMGRFLTLNATGSVENPLNMKRLKANLKFDGAMRDPSSTLALLNKIAGLGKEVRVPTFQVSGLAQINGQNYSGDIRLLTSAGNLAAQGSLSVNSETFDLHADMHGLDLDAVMPSLGVGTLTGSIDATGAGFNPLLPHSDLELTARLSQVSYRGNSLAPLSLDASARSGQYTLDLSSGGPHSDLTLTGTGSLRGHTYFADLTAHANYVDLQALGLIDEVCRGSGDISLSGSANPSDMLFDLQMSLDDIDWEFAENFYSFHHAFQADFLAERDLTALHITGDQLDIDFTSPLGLRPLLACTDKIMPAIKKQIDSRQIDFETLQPELPQFTLKFDSGGEGLLHEILDGTGYTFSSLSASLSNTDRLQGNAQLLQAADKSMTLDTVTLALTQQGQRMNYRLHIGNLPSRLPELADVNLTGYLGGNRASLFLRQKNAKGEVGYRLGLTAALLDSAINLHFTPVNARIAYQNWSVNDDNYIQLGPASRLPATWPPPRATAPFRCTP